jgi:hypothetical protein
MTPSTTPRKRGAAAKTETQAALAKTAPETVAPVESVDAIAWKDEAAEIRKTAADQIRAARFAKLTELVEAGNDNDEVAATLGLSVARVLQLKREAGLTSSRKRDNAERDQKIREAFEAGTKVEDVAKTYHLSVARTRQIKSALGLASPGRSRIEWSSDEQRDEANAAVQALADIAVALGSSAAAILRKVEREADAA